jgi:hypothetical protein
MSFLVSDVVLIIEPAGTNADILFETGLNDKFLQQKPLSSSIRRIALTTEDSENRSREQTPIVEAERMAWAITLGHTPRKGGCWIFGRDAATCDFLLAKEDQKDTGVSGQHFEVCYNADSMVLMIRNRSKQMAHIFQQRAASINATIHTLYNPMGLQEFGQAW